MIENLKFRFNYLKDNWRLIIHLLFRTYRFGVDNDWWSNHNSIMGLPLYKRWNLFKNYTCLRKRAFMGFIPVKDACILFPKYAKKMNYSRGEKSK